MQGGAARVDESRNEGVLRDEAAFAEAMQGLARDRFSGMVSLFAPALDAQLFFVRGHIRGVRAGRKSRELAVLALWRIFPAVFHADRGAAAPEWAELGVDYGLEEIVQLALKTASFFRENFGSPRFLRTRYAMNGIQSDAVEALPANVRKILLCFDGTRSIEEILNFLVIDEFLLLQIIRRLLDENLIAECGREEGDAAQDEDETFSDDDGEISRTPSVMFYVGDLDSESPQIHVVSSDVRISGIEPGKPIPRDVGDLLRLEDPEEYERHSREEVLAHLGDVEVVTADNEILPNVVYDAIFLRHETIRDEEIALAQQAEDEEFLNLCVDESDVEPEPEPLDDTSARIPSAVYCPRNIPEYAPWDEVDDVASSSPDRLADAEYSTSGHHKIVKLTESEQQRAVSPSGHHRRVDVTPSGRHRVVELSPEQWKSQTMARLQRENKRRGARRLRILLCVLIAALALLLLVLVMR